MNSYKTNTHLEKAIHLKSKGYSGNCGCKKYTANQPLIVLKFLPRKTPLLHQTVDPTRPKPGNSAQKKCSTHTESMPSYP